MPRPAYFYGATEETFERAKSLRKEMTNGEKLFWQILRRNNVKGFYFRRQHPINRYIADFYCHKAKLVVELDGEVHNSIDAKEHDENRDAVMMNFGITVLRFKNDDAVKNTDFVVKEIEKHLISRAN